MKKTLLLLLLPLILPILIFSQNLSQTVRGTILDIDSKLPLIGAVVTMPNTSPLIGTTTDVDGHFRFENVPVGRLTIQISYLGYEEKTIPNIIVNSGKEVVLNFTMEESIVAIDEVVIEAFKNKGEAINDLALLSSRSISPEQTSMYAGGFNDPSRIVSNFAGVTNTQDGGNDIIVRGNSPKYVQWRLEGIQITNPNHFADQGSIAGAISTLNNNMMATSDFYTGAFAPEYGDVLSGIYDVKLRTGNNEKYESVFGFGLLGTDFTFEGPFKKGYGGSFIVNYRYSTASIISDLGLIDVGGIPKFQDAAFKVVLPTKKVGVFSMFGLGGLSSFLYEDVTPALWITPGDNKYQPNIKEDYQKKAHLANIGLNHTMPINNNSYFKTTLALSSEGIDDNIFEKDVLALYNNEGAYLRDSILQRTQNFTGAIDKTVYRAALTYNNKINAKHKIQIGTKYNLFRHKMNQSQYVDSPDDRFTLLDFDENIGTVQNFATWKYRPTQKLSIVTGLHNMNILFNKKSTIESRFAANYTFNTRNTLSFGWGEHSTMENVHSYFAKVEQPDGSIIEPNRDLGLLRARHFVLGYEKRFGRNLRAKVETYYQDLYDLPVANDPNSFYSTINESLDFQYVDLVNEGSGENYGLEFTLEKFFSNNYYYLINASIYQSKYTALDGIERNTTFNGEYLANILFGKEFVGLGKKNNQTLGLNGKIFFGGGKKIISLLRDDQGALAVNPTEGQFWDFENAYENSLEDTKLFILSASYKWNRKKATHELFLNLDNLANTKGKISEFYDESEPDNIGYMTQFGFFPNLMYRVYF